MVCPGPPSEEPLTGRQVSLRTGEESVTDHRGRKRAKAHNIYAGQVFEKPTFAADFVSGRMFCNTVASFKKHEDPGNSGRLARIHRWTALGTALEAAGGCSFESGIMVLEQKPARKEGAPNRCCHRTIPTVSASPLTITAWWPMPACSCRPPSPGTWACGNSSTITLTSAARQGGPTGGTRC